MYRPLFEPSCQEEFEHIVTNFILGQEERITQLEDYMQVIVEEFMEFSLEVARRLKERIKENENKPRKIKKITKYPDTKVLKNSAKHDFLENLEKKTFPTPANLLCAMSKRDRSTRGQASSSRKETMEEMVCKFGLFDNEDHQMNYNNLVGHSIHLRDVVDWEYELLHKGVTFRLGGVEREMSLLELEWRPIIGDGGYNVGNTKAKSMNPWIKLAHRCITMTISGRKETTNRVTEIDLFYLYCIFEEGVVCNIPYWLAKYLKSIRDKRVIIELHEGECCWLDTRGVKEGGKVDDEGGDEEGGNEGVGGSADIYCNMS
ncbi:hypothetical protein Tco_0653737 [Tanacetum coccineum]|uniref:Uncharacterized protein n=1 Tax=Tanacetum coccineum TaxID=301880 RepID=A0ABQ4X1K9_9ASTR